MIQNVMLALLREAVDVTKVLRRHRNQLAGSRVPAEEGSMQCPHQARDPHASLSSGG